MYFFLIIRLEFSWNVSPMRESQTPVWAGGWPIMSCVGGGNTLKFPENTHFLSSNVLMSQEGHSIIVLGLWEILYYYSGRHTNNEKWRAS
jgi:hypothetical protein